ncbi:MAG: RecQ family ATP-dependent DNA helicase [Paracoccaceae bacterium]|nr:RecQ family ATP-dependent DNA helicase [Paracoccaceae bacterium]
MSYYFRPQWRKLRFEILNRDEWTCCECRKSIKGRDAHVHHKLPRALGGQDIEVNLISLCGACHATRHSNLHVGLGAQFLQSTAVRIAKLFGGEELKNFQGDRLGVALRYMGVKRLRPNQLEPIVAALNGEHILLISPTGSGKSLCFQIPALLAKSHSLVVSPLKALMADQVVGLLRRNFPATFINSDLSREEMAQRLDFLERGIFKLVYLAPERFVASRKRQRELQVIHDNRPSYLIVDEAHCIDKWGDAFRPAYSELGTYHKQLGSPPILAFTATANKETRNEILKSLKAEKAKIFVEDLDRKNIALARLQKHDDKDRAKLIGELHANMRHQCSGKTLVFVPTIKKGEQVRDLLLQHEISAQFFHGRLPKMEREQIIAQFHGDAGLEGVKENSCLICTNAFGMGMDIPDVRLVFHWHHPSSVEDYAQEFGRAGRDGRQSLAVLFTKSDDEKLLNFMAKKSVEGSNISPQARSIALEKRKNSIQKIKSFANQRDKCFNQLLLDELGSTHKPIPRLSKFFLSLAFAQRQKRERRNACCDGCWRKRNARKATMFAREVVEIMEIPNQRLP